MNLTLVFCMQLLFQADSRNIAKMRQHMFWGRGQPQPHSLLSWSLEQTLYSQATTWLLKEKYHDYAHSREPGFIFQYLGDCLVVMVEQSIHRC